MSSPRDVLIVYGGMELHQPETTSHIIARMLEHQGLSVDITPDLSALGDANIAARRLIIPNITGGEIDDETVAKLIQAVRQGVGLGGHHHCLSTTFRSSPEFHYMTGCLFVGHPGNIRDYRIDISRPDDPVVRGIGSFNYRSEQYYMLVDPSLDVLATTTFDGSADPATTNVTMPVVYKRHFGKGRIFYSALGHVASEFDRPGMRTILTRGLGWAAGVDSQ